MPRAQRRAQLLASALRVFVKKGYHATAMEDIAGQIPVMAQRMDATRDVVEQEVAATQQMSAMAGEVTAAVGDVAGIASRTTELAQRVTAATEEND